MTDMNTNDTKHTFPCGRVAHALNRRDWLRRAGGGAGMIALANLLAEQQLLGAQQEPHQFTGTAAQSFSCQSESSDLAVHGRRT